MTFYSALAMQQRPNHLLFCHVREQVALAHAKAFLTANPNPTVQAFYTHMDQVFDFLKNEMEGDNDYDEEDDDMIEEGRKKKKNKPTNPSLWQQSLSWAKQRYEVCPSAYCNGAAVKRYNSKGGKWKKG
jgi:hypothetical protein